MSFSTLSLIGFDQFKRRLQFPTIIRWTSSFASMLLLAALSQPVLAEGITAPDASLGQQWPKFDGAYLRMKGGGLIRLPTLEDVVLFGDVDAYHTFNARINGYKIESMLVIDPQKLAQTPLVDASEIEAFIVRGTSLSRVRTIAKISEILRDPNGRTWSVKHKKRSYRPVPKLEGDWSHLLAYSNWGSSTKKLRREIGPNRLLAYHLGEMDLNTWKIGDWEDKRPFNIPVHGFVIDSGMGRHKFGVFRIKK